MKRKVNHLTLKLQESRDLGCFGHWLYLLRAGAQQLTEAPLPMCCLELPYSCFLPLSSQSLFLDHWHPHLIVHILSAQLGAAVSAPPGLTGDLAHPLAHLFSCFHTPLCKLQEETLSLSELLFLNPYSPISVEVETVHEYESSLTLLLLLHWRLQTLVHVFPLHSCSDSLTRAAQIHYNLAVPRPSVGHSLVRFSPRSASFRSLQLWYLILTSASHPTSLLHSWAVVKAVPHSWHAPSIESWLLVAFSQENLHTEPKLQFTLSFSSLQWRITVEKIPQLRRQRPLPVQTP